MRFFPRARTSFFVTLAVAGVLSACDPAGVFESLAQQDEPPATVEEPGDLPAVAANLRNTHYYTIFETDYDDRETRTRDVLDSRGAVLARVSESFYDDLVLEGSGKLVDGRVLNYHKRVADGDYRFIVSAHAWGNGVGDCSLAPYRTIAVDRDVIPLGSLVYIDETVGMPLPDGTLHDGRWRAEDIGSAIRKDRVDIYVGKRGWNTYLSRHGIGHLESLRVRILKLPDGESCAY